MSCGALARISPSSPMPASLPSSVTVRSCVVPVALPSVLASCSSESRTLPIAMIGASVRP